jgi:hypothetical protein
VEAEEEMGVAAVGEVEEEVAGFPRDHPPNHRSLLLSIHPYSIH